MTLQAGLLAWWLNHLVYGAVLGAASPLALEDV